MINENNKNSQIGKQKVREGERVMWKERKIDRWIKHHFRPTHLMGQIVFFFLFNFLKVKAKIVILKNKVLC